ncbi:MAG: agmatinase [bacterium]
MKVRIQKPNPPFLATKSSAENCVWQIVGLPYDATSSYRRGSRFAPREIRIASDSIETYSPYRKQDLEHLNVHDAGDLRLEGCTPEAAVAVIADYYYKQTQQGKRLLGIGGEHSVTNGALQGLVQAGLKPFVLHLDAHLDLRESYTGGAFSHASVARRMAELVGAERLIQWGMRSGEAAEFQWALDNGTYWGRDFTDLQSACQRLRDEPVYITLDLDVFDPAEFPSVGNPEPGGMTFSEFCTFLQEISQQLYMGNWMGEFRPPHQDIVLLNVVGMDVVEYSPLWDAGGRSAIFAAEIIRELLLTVVHH